MASPQRSALIASAKRLGLSLSLVLAAVGWGFNTYDRTNAKVANVKAWQDSVVARRTLDSLRASYEYHALQGAILRTDSAVRKVCTATRAAC